MNKTFDRRIAELEATCHDLRSEVELLRKQLNLDDDWVSIAKAASLMPDQTDSQIRSRIKESKEDPNAPFQRGKCWRGHTRYLIHVRNWQKTLEEIWKND